MTIIAMSAGMLTAALGWVEGDPSFRQPMDTVVIGGLVASTLRSLLVYAFAGDLGGVLTKQISAKPDAKEKHAG